MYSVSIYKRNDDVVSRYYYSAPLPEYLTQGRCRQEPFILWLVSQEGAQVSGITGSKDGSDE